MRRSTLFCSLGKILFVTFLILATAGGKADAAEMARLTESTWDDFVPKGKEVDSIYGDYVLRNDRLTAVVANPIRGRDANMTTHEVGCGVIDLTVLRPQSDQLSAYYPGGLEFPYTLKSSSLGAEDTETETARAASVELACTSPAAEGRPAAEVTYTLRDGEPYLRVTSVYRNTTSKSMTVSLEDVVRADRTFEKSPDGPAPFFWAYDKWFGQAYGVYTKEYGIESKAGRRYGTTVLTYSEGAKTSFTLEPGKRIVLRRLLFPKSDLLGVLAEAERLRGGELHPVTLNVADANGAPVGQADLTLTRNGKPYGNARTGNSGRLALELPPGKYQGQVTALARGSTDLLFDLPGGKQTIEVPLPLAASVTAKITDSKGRPIACKVQFQGISGTPSPNFGTDSGEHAVGNLYYSHNGSFTQILPPGTYRVIISHGPEYDAVYQPLEVPEEKQVSLKAKLTRVVDTRGWVSSDFHSHSSPSGDNTSSQLGRVLNLVAEHIEFGPCTEHGRLSSYTPHLKYLGIESAMATAVGMELSRSPGTVDHQNAFPLILKPHTQDGGGPRTDPDPEVQIRRLALWDNNSDKLVQQNHPDIGHVFYDADADGKADGGFKRMFGFMDVIEVHPLQRILTMQPKGADGRRNHRIFNWLQLLNQGYRIPGVVNTDAHYTFHGSGWLRNYIRSPKTDDPAKIQTMDVVHASEHGNVIMTTGPFLEVYTGKNGRSGNSVTAGDTVSVPDGKVTLRVRVQCPNWFDIDRVQILVNGRPDQQFNFTRATTPESFGEGVVKFNRKIEIELDGDAHLIAVAVGENSKLGDVMGPQRGEMKPIAVSNPIYVDVDGEGFKPNGDTLDAPLPLFPPRSED